MKKGANNFLKIDFTPMVDMGFLLLMSFIMLHHLQKPAAMNMTLPGQQNMYGCGIACFRASKFLTIVLAEKDKLYFYQEIERPAIDSIDFSKPSNIRGVLAAKKAEIARMWGAESELSILIKPTNKSNYKNLVDVLDEMNINRIENHTIINFTQRDSMIFLRELHTNISAMP